MLPNIPTVFEPSNAPFQITPTGAAKFVTKEIIA